MSFKMVALINSFICIIINLRVLFPYASSSLSEILKQVRNGLKDLFLRMLNTSYKVNGSTGPISAGMVFIGYNDQTWIMHGSIWLLTIPPGAYGHLQFFSVLVVYFPPPARRQRQFPTPELLIELICVFLGVHLFKSTIGFHTIVTQYVFRTLKRLVEFIERRMIHIKCQLKHNNKFENEKEQKKSAKACPW